MEPVTKKDLNEMEERLGTCLETKIGEMGSTFEVKMGTLGGEIVEAVDAVLGNRLSKLRTELKRDMMDVSASISVEIDRKAAKKITEHVSAYHSYICFSVLRSASQKRCRTQSREEGIKVRSLITLYS